MTFSPYELLRASIPQPRPSIVTPYDVYSHIQQETAAPAQTSFSLPPDSPPPASAPSALSPAIRKTHYISDIHIKHTAAQRRAAFTHEPLQ